MLRKFVKVVVGLALGLRAGWAVGDQSRRLLEDLAPRPKSCVQSTSFRRIDAVDQKSALSEVTGFEGDDGTALLLSHGTPKKRNTVASEGRFYEMCDEVDVAVLDGRNCALVAETNSKALPYHVLRYKQGSLVPRVPLDLPTDPSASQQRVVTLMANFESLGAALRPVLVEASTPTSGRKGRVSKMRQSGDGRVAVTVAWSSADATAVANALCSPGGRATPLVVFARTDALAREARDAGLEHVFFHDALATDRRDWLVLSAVYSTNALGFDVLFQEPLAVWHASPWDVLLKKGADVVFATQGPLDDAALAPFFASPHFFYLRCNWRTEMLLDWLIFTLDLVASASFAPTLAQHLSEAHSQLGLDVAVLPPTLVAVADRDTNVADEPALWFLADSCRERLCTTCVEGRRRRRASSLLVEIF